MEVTVEISCQKFPSGTELPVFWEMNRYSFIRVTETAQKGLRGHVLDHERKPIKGAQITIKGRERFVVKADEFTGKFFRILLPGEYTLMIKSEKESHEFEITIPNSGFLARDFIFSNGKASTFDLIFAPETTVTLAPKREVDTFPILFVGGCFCLFLFLWYLNRRRQTNGSRAPPKGATFV